MFDEHPMPGILLSSFGPWVLDKQLSIDRIQEHASAGTLHAKVKYLALEQKEIRSVWPPDES